MRGDDTIDATFNGRRGRTIGFNERFEEEGREISQKDIIEEQEIEDDDKFGEIGEDGKVINSEVDEDEERDKAGNIFDAK